MKFMKVVNWNTSHISLSSDGSQIAFQKYFLMTNQTNWQKGRKKVLNEVVLVTND